MTREIYVRPGVFVLDTWSAPSARSGHVACADGVHVAGIVLAVSQPIHPVSVIIGSHRHRNSGMRCPVTATSRWRMMTS